MSASQAGRRGFDSRLPLSMKIKSEIHLPGRPVYLFFLTVFFLQSCGFFLQKNAPAPHEVAKKCYKEGLLSLNSGSLIQAEICFKRALQQENKYAPALEGMARIYFMRGKINPAEQFLDAAVQADKNWLPAYLLKGKILLQKEDYDLALEELQQAEFLSRAHHLPALQKTIQPFLAEAYAGCGNFKQALVHYKNARRQKSADPRLKQKIADTERSLLLLRGKGSALQKMMLQKTISRADLAVLLTQYLEAKVFSDTLVNGRIRDLPMAKLQGQAVQKTVRAGLLPLLPDGTFHPGDRVDRAEAALFMEHILKQHANGFMPAPAAYFKDVESWQPYLQAAALSISLKLIPSGREGYFFPGRYLNGKEALAMIYRLAELLKLPSFPAYLLRDKSDNAEQN